tara:strand:+ start:11917 stop:13080 length:1164 start_codon:yes stop_codon:yes gene_type:complete
VNNKTLKIIINWIFKDNFLSVLVIVFFCSEAYGKIITLSGSNTNIQSIIKFVFFIFISFKIIFYFKKYFHFQSIIGLSLCFLIGQYFIPDGFSRKIIVLFLRYIFPLILFIYFNNHLIIKENSKKLLFKIFEVIIILNTFLIVFGFLFKIQFFETYEFSRFGYNGLLRNSSAGTYFYLISLFYFLYSYKEQFFNKWKSVLVFIVCFFIGTKSIYFGLSVVTLTYLFFRYKNYKKKYLLSFIFVLTTFILGYLLFFEFGQFNHIRQSDGLASSILSYRNQLFLNNTLPNIKQNWSFINYLIGGLNNINARSQLDIIDVIHFWGFLGGAFYLFIYYKFLITFKLVRIDLIFIVFLIFLIFFAGNFFTYTTIPIYLLIIREKMQSNTYYL